MSKSSLEKARKDFHARNLAVVEDTRKRIEEFRKQAIQSFERTRKEREMMLETVGRNLNETVEEIRLGHEAVRNRLNREAVRRDVHLRVNRSLEALQEFIRIQRESDIDEAALLAALADPAIAGSAQDKEKRASASDLIMSVQKQIIQQTEFINIAAHELRTPVMPILAYAEIAESEMGRKSEAVDAIRRNAIRLQRLTENILNVARIDSNSLRLNLESMDLKSFVGDALRERKGKDRVPVHVELPSDQVVVFADKERMTQVLTNILDNAMKFTKSEVRIRVSQEDGRGVVEIQDDGAGIDANLFPILFTKFAAKSAGGTGLGLFISRGIVEAHGGIITASNNADKGASFVIKIPIASPELRGAEIPPA